MRDGGPIRASDVRLLRIGSAYARTLGLVETHSRVWKPPLALWITSILHFNCRA
jgi:hypothetical protein